jgi:ClpP class serine protease
MKAFQKSADTLIIENRLREAIAGDLVGYDDLKKLVGRSVHAGGPCYGNLRTALKTLEEERIVFLGTAINDEVANSIIAQLLFLANEDSKNDIHLYVNSPGGSVSAGLAIIDTMMADKQNKKLAKHTKSHAH